MVKKRIINTIATVALGLSLVGVANANSLDNLMPKTNDSMQSQFNTAQQEMNKNMRNMSDSLTVKEEVKAEVEVSTEDNEATVDNINRMNPNMPSQAEMLEAMDDIHQRNSEDMLEVHESMSEVHKSMPYNQMHAAIDK